MKMPVYAVITGDVVGSSTIKRSYADELKRIAADIAEKADGSFLFDVFRGDSFQGLTTDPAKSLLLGIIIRAGLRRNTKGRGLLNVWDARLSIGIGAVTNFEPKPDIKLGTLDGEAFRRSGRGLDNMKDEGALLMIKTGDEALDDEFAAVCPLLDTIIGRWSTTQAEAIYLHLLENLTQQEIGKRLNISQRAIGKRLEASNINSMTPFFERYQRLTEWKFKT